MSNYSFNIFLPGMSHVQLERKLINTLKETFKSRITISATLISEFSCWNEPVRSYHHDGRSHIWRMPICCVPPKQPVPRSRSAAASNIQTASRKIMWLIWCCLPISARLPLPPPSVYQYQMLGDKRSQWHNRDLQNGLCFPQTSEIARWCHWVDGNKSVYTVIVGWLRDAVGWEHLRECS